MAELTDLISEITPYFSKVMVEFIHSTFLAPELYQDTLKVYNKIKQDYCSTFIHTMLY